MTILCIRPRCVLTAVACQESVKGLKWQEKRISAAIKSENVLKGLNVGGTSTLGVVTPFYVPMGVGSNSYVVSNGQYNYSYGSVEGGHSAYRQGGRGGPGGRRGTGSAAPVNGVEGADGTRRTGPGKKKGRGIREGPTRDGGVENGRLPGSSLPSGSKESQQASINLADFPPILEAKGQKKDVDSESTKPLNNDGDAQKKENIAPSAGDSNKPSVESTSTASNCVPESSASASVTPKKSYAQMALAAAAAAAAPAGPVAAQLPSAQGVAAPKAE